MNNKKNIIVMFLLVMLSFAIISEVSAASDAEADGTGLDPSIVDTHVNGERMGHDLKSQNEQNSFNNTSEGNVEHKKLYEHGVGDNYCELPLNNTSEFDVCKKFDGNESFGFNKSGDIKSFEFRKFEDVNFNKSFDHLKNNFSDFNEMDMNFTVNKFNNNHTKVVQNNGEALSDVIPDLMGLEKIAPNIKKDNSSAKKTNHNKSPKKSEKHKIKKPKKTHKKSINVKNNPHRKSKKERAKL